MTTAERLEIITNNMYRLSDAGYRRGYDEGYEQGCADGEWNGWDSGYNSLIYETQPLLDEILALQESYTGGSDDAVDK